MTGGIPSKPRALISKGSPRPCGPQLVTSSEILISGTDWEITSPPFIAYDHTHLGERRLKQNDCGSDFLRQAGLQLSPALCVSAHHALSCHAGSGPSPQKTASL